MINVLFVIGFLAFALDGNHLAASAVAMGWMLYAAVASASSVNRGYVPPKRIKGKVRDDRKR